MPINELIYRTQIKTKYFRRSYVKCNCRYGSKYQRNFEFLCGGILHVVWRTVQRRLYGCHSIVLYLHWTSKYIYFCTPARVFEDLTKSFSPPTVALCAIRLDEWKSKTVIRSRCGLDRWGTERRILLIYRLRSSSGVRRYPMAGIHGWNNHQNINIQNHLIRSMLKFRFTSNEFCPANLQYKRKSSRTSPLLVAWLWLYHRSSLEQSQRQHVSL